MQYFGQRSGFVSSVAVLVALVTSVSAQSLQDARPPAEIPPASFTGNQYVDSRGCVFVRAGIGGVVDWVPRVTRDREQLCGFEPTQIAAAPTTAPFADVPNPLDTPVAGLPPRDADPVDPPTVQEPEPEAQVASTAPAVPTLAPETAPAPVVRPVAAPQPPAEPSPSEPPVQAEQPVTVTSASTPTRPTPRSAPTVTPTPTAATPPAPPAPRPVAAPSPQVITTPPSTPERRTVTRAEACDGRFGVQPNFVSTRTGEPIDCGSEPQQVAAATTPVSQQNIQRMTRAAACADAAATGRQYISVRTGLPVDCAGVAVPAQTPVQAPVAAGPAVEQPSLLARIRADLARPQQSYSNPLDRAPGATAVITNRPITASRSPTGYRNPLDSAPGSTFIPGVNTQLTSCDATTWSVQTSSELRCRPQTAGTSDPAPASDQTVTYARAQARPAAPLAQFLTRQPPPYSNPTFSTGPARVPDGYERVWSDGRINFQRGIPTASHAQSTAQYATQPIQQTPQITTRAAAPIQPRAEQIGGNRYVQVGTYSSRTEAQRVAQALRSLGLPMRIGLYKSGGQDLRIVLAGPFASNTQLQSALGTARSAGHTGAFTRQ